MRTLNLIGRLATLATGLVLVSACAAGTAGSPSASPDTGSASEPDSPVLFTLTSTCDESSEPAPAGVTKPHPEAIWGVCDQTATDPRLSGRWTGYVLFQGDPNGDWEMSSTGTVENDSGSWACKDFGTGSTTLAASDGVCIGQDGYEGLTAYSHTVSTDRTATGGTFGWIVESP
jgi:hypothetical protein